MKWAEISVYTTNEAEEAVANILHETGAKGVVIEEVPSDEQDDRALEDTPQTSLVLKAYLPVNSAINETVDTIRQRVHALRAFRLDVGSGNVTVQEVDSQDWESAWKKYFKPVRVTKRIVVKPSWESFDTDNPQDIVIELDPGMAFGTGTHPSTILSLRALEETVHGGEQVIDVGCGSGILSIAAVKLGAQHVLALDIDEAAVKATKENTAVNGVEAHVTTRQNDLLHGVTHTADIVVANILADVITSFVPDVAKALSPGGLFIASGIIKAKEWMVQKALIEQHFVIAASREQEDWVAITAQKR